MSGRISFIGAGPGAADLITVRGARRIAEADVVVWAASLVAPECIREHARADAELVDSSRLTHEQAVEIYRRAERDRLSVARVHSGDPALWGAVQEQYDVCTRMDLEVEIVPGVPAFSAAAASVGRELTVPEIAQSVVLTRLEGGKTPMPDGEKVREFARHGTTMALFLSAARVGQLVTELRAGGYPDDVPVLIAYKVTWPDELMLRTTLGELEQTVKQHKLWRHTLFIVGRALSEGGTRSRMYHAGHFHTYRRADPVARSALRSESRYRPRSSADQDAASDELPRPRGGRSESNVAWWAVRDWQETARNSPRTSSGSRSARTPDDEQPELFGEQSAEASVAGTAVPDASVTVAEEVAPSAVTESPVADVSAANGESSGSMRAEDGPTPSTGDATSAESVGSRASASTRGSAKSANASTTGNSGKSPTGKTAKTGKTTTAKTAARKSTKTPSARRKTTKSDDQTE